MFSINVDLHVIKLTYIILPSFDISQLWS